MVANAAKQWLWILAVLIALPLAAQFRTPPPGSAVDEAAKATAPASEHKKAIDAGWRAMVLTETPGFDTKPYLETICAVVRKNWYAAISESVEKPNTRSGEVTVRFAIVRSGEVRDLHIHESSGEKDLDDAALNAVKSSGPLPPLPKGLTPDALTLQFHFLYKNRKGSRWWKGQ